MPPYDTTGHISLAWRGEASLGGGMWINATAQHTAQNQHYPTSTAGPRAHHAGLPTRHCELPVRPRASRGQGCRDRPQELV